MTSEKGRSAYANTGDVNEDLGQIEYLIADKAGTITTENLKLKSCYICGRLYRNEVSNPMDSYRSD